MGVGIMARAMVMGMVFCLFCAGTLRAQGQNDLVWVQIEAHPDLVTAQARLRAFGADPTTAPLAGFMMRTGMYALALGPLPRAEAMTRLRDLRALGRIPRDSYLQSAQNYTRQFWPIAAQTPMIISVDPLPEPMRPSALAAQETADRSPTARPSLAQARASEAALDPSTRDDIQRALAWHDHHRGAIDGAFGPATRAAMAAWQRANDQPETGVLTEAERTALLANWRRELASLGLETIRKTEAGIQTLFPASLVEFTAYAPPFAVFAPKDARGVEMVLISANGGATRLQSLFETLTGPEIMPKGGMRDLLRDGFNLASSDETRFATGFARLDGDAVKGVLIRGPAEQYLQIARLMPQIEESFTSIEGVLSAASLP